MDLLEREEPNYFGAGPALLPTGVLQQAAQDLLNYNGSGIGVGEIRHKSVDAVKIVNEAKKNITELLNVPNTHEVFFLQGGATSGFTSIATNLTSAFIKKTGERGTPYYACFGTWAQKAMNEAERLGFEPKYLVNAKDENGDYTKIPDIEDWNIPEDLSEISYICTCDNETASGLEIQDFPFHKFPGVEIVSDMSSNLLSKPIDVSKYGVIYAGAQKNVGIAGITIYIIKKSLLDQETPAKLREMGVQQSPITFHYPFAVANNSAHNTLPVFPMLIIKLVTEKLVKDGGLKKQELSNIEKSSKVYAILDKYPEVYEMYTDKKFRSKMNIAFHVKGGQAADDTFIEEAMKKTLYGVAGHKSLNGIRISLYNAITMKSVDLLCEFIEEFAKSR